MKIAKQYKVREMAGEHIIVMPGRYGADMTRVVALNATSLYLWEELADREFTTDEVVALLTDRYEIDSETARRDAEKWIEQLSACGILEQ
ncbi:MAG: PqqD family protein [Rikenellaceae bacterium]|nr:PqqD family protein [Rikenellaceae bacterium]